MNEEEIRKRKLNQSPTRDKYDTPVRPQQSPYKLLRMMSQFKSVETVRSRPDLDDTNDQPVPKRVQPKEPVHNRYFELQKRFDALPRLSTKETALERVPKVQLLRPRTRHEDFGSEDLSISYHSNTNYSRLDYRAPQPREDDARSIATQDMLLDDDNASIVLDPQTISALRKAQDEKMEEIPFDRRPTFVRPRSDYASSVHSCRSNLRYSSQPGSSVGSTSPSAHGKSVDSQSISRDKRSVQNGFDLGPPRSVHYPPSVQDREEIMPMNKDRQSSVSITMEDHIREDELLGPNDIHGQDTVQEDRLSPDEQDKPLVPKDFSESYDLMNDDNAIADTDWGDDDYGQSWSDNELNDTTLQPPTENLPGTFELRHERLITLHKSITATATKQLFMQKMSHNVKSNISASHLANIKNMFLDQFVNDLRRSQNDRSVIKTEDIILLMKRQQILNDKTSISSLAHKYLPREYSEQLCKAAIKYNEVYPS